jgi:hypothetical protein
MPVTSSSADGRWTVRTSKNTAGNPAVVGNTVLRRISKVLTYFKAFDRQLLI